MQSILPVIWYYCGLPASEEYGRPTSSDTIAVGSPTTAFPTSGDYQRRAISSTIPISIDFNYHRSGDIAAPCCTVKGSSNYDSTPIGQHSTIVVPPQQPTAAPQERLSIPLQSPKGGDKPITVDPGAQKLEDDSHRVLVLSMIQCLVDDPPAVFEKLYHPRCRHRSPALEDERADRSDPPPSIDV